MADLPADWRFQAERASWQARFARAQRLLSSSALSRRLATEVARLDARQDARARLLAGRERLRAARRVGVVPGSFNPLTSAHVALVDSARATARLDVVVWLMATHSVDKETVERATLLDRLAQLVAFTRADRHAALAISNRGLYVEEARALRVLLAPEAELNIVVGFDKITQIFDPRYYTNRDGALGALFGEARLLVAPRADAGREALEHLLARPENTAFAARVTYVEMPPLHTEESSTMARELASQEAWERLPALLPPEGVALARTGAYAEPQSPAGVAYARRAEPFV